MSDISTDEKPECWAVFHGRGGYPGEKEKALSTFEVGKPYKVIGGSMGQSHTSLTIEGFDGGWNSVMFNVDLRDAPIQGCGIFAKKNELAQERARTCHCKLCRRSREIRRIARNLDSDNAGKLLSIYSGIMDEDEEKDMQLYELRHHKDERFKEAVAEACRELAQDAKALLAFMAQKNVPISTGWYADIQQRIKAAGVSIDQ